MKTLPIAIAVMALGLPAPAAPAAAPDPASAEARRIINDSYNFRKNQEPEMTEEEYALYEKIVAMIAVKPEFAFTLLEPLVSGAQPRSPAFELVAGNLYFTNGRNDLAERHYRRALGRLPSFSRAWLNLGSLYYAQARYAEAGDCLVKAVEGGERDAHTLGLLAFCLERTGRKTAAEMDYIQALGLEPDGADYLEGLVRIYYDSKRYAPAEALLEQLIRLKPGERRHWLLYAAVLSAEDRKLDALAVLQAADGLGLLDATGLATLGDLCAQLQFYPEATDAFQRLRALNPELGADRLLLLARVLIGGGQFDAAEKVLGAINSELSRPNQIAFLQARADLAAARERWAEAKAPLEALLALDPLNGRALLGLGRVYKSANDLAHADVLFESAARQPETAHRACLELADDALRLRRYARGLDYLERAAAIERTPVLQQYITKVRLLIDHENAPNTVR